EVAHGALGFRFVAGGRLLRHLLVGFHLGSVGARGGGSLRRTEPGGGVALGLGDRLGVVGRRARGVGHGRAGALLLAGAVVAPGVLGVPVVAEQLAQRD